MSTIETDARRAGTRQRLSFHGSLSLRPAVNSEMSTAISQIRSSAIALRVGWRVTRPTPAGPIA